MANCPKCNQHLRLIDWKQHCPNCGANIFVYDLQERLMCQADVAEVQNYYFQKKVDRVKASFIGSKLAIARIFTSLLPVGAIFLPLIHIDTSLEGLSSLAGNFSAITLIKNSDALGNIDLGALLQGGSPLFTASVLCLVLSLVLWLLHFILLTLSCSPKGKIRNTVINIFMLLTTLLFPVLFMLLPKDGAVSGSVLIGSYVYFALQLANAVIDWLTLKKGIEIKYKEATVGGIPVEEYLQMKADGVPHEEIRSEQYRRMQMIHDEKERQILEKQQQEQKEESTQ